MDLAEAAVGRMTILTSHPFIANVPRIRMPNFEGNCSGQFLIPIFQTSHEFNRFHGFHHSSRYRADMGASAVPACQKESSETT